MKNNNGNVYRKISRKLVTIVPNTSTIHNKKKLLIEKYKRMEAEEEIKKYNIIEG